MKKLRKISLEDFDRLSSMEASKLMGGQETGAPYPYRPVTFAPPPVTKPLPITATIGPGGGTIGGTIKF